MSGDIVFLTLGLGLGLGLALLVVPRLQPRDPPPPPPPPEIDTPHRPALCRPMAFADDPTSAGYLCRCWCWACQHDRHADRRANDA